MKATVKENGILVIYPAGLMCEDGHLCLSGVLRGEETSLSVPMTTFASLPFSPGKYFEIQQGEETYRCYPKNGRLVMRFVNLVKIHYELSIAERTRAKRVRREECITP